jgi:hypothetical protein
MADIPTLYQTRKENVKIYGVYFNHTGSDSKINMIESYKTIETLESLHVSYELSYFARAKILETYYLSKVWYTGLFSVLSNDTISNIEKCASKYVWYRVTDNNLVKLNTVKLPVDRGGLGLVDISGKVEAMSLMLFLRLRRLNFPDKTFFVYYYEKVKKCQKNIIGNLIVAEIYKRINSRNIL